MLKFLQTQFSARMPVDRSGTSFATADARMSMSPVVSTGRGAPMSTTMNQTHIAYDLLDRTKPAVVVIAFETHDLTDPTHGKELGDELDSLICPDLPMRYVLDFEGVRAMGSTAFCELAAFARRVRWWGGQVTACNL